MLGPRREHLYIALGQGAGALEKALGYERSATTDFAFSQDDFVPGALQDARRRPANGRLVVLDEGVVEEHDAALGAADRLAVGKPARKRLASKGRQPPAAVDAQQRIQQPAIEPTAAQPIRQGRQGRSPAADAGYVGKEPRPQRIPVLAMVVGEKLVLELGHIHARRALGLAGFALQAEVHHAVDGLAVQAIGQRAGERGAQGIGAAASGVLLV